MELILAIIFGCFYYLTKRQYILILAFNSFYFHVLHYFDIIEFGANYYLQVLFIEFVTLLLLISARAKIAVPLLFLVSMLYNGVSFVEFNTDMAFFHSLYPDFMRCIGAALVALVATGWHYERRMDNRGSADFYYDSRGWVCSRALL